MAIKTRNTDPALAAYQKVEKIDKPAAQPAPPPAPAPRPAKPPPPALPQIYVGGKTAIKLRIDTDVLEAFKATGSGWQTRINATLRAALRHAGALKP